MPQRERVAARDARSRLADKDSEIAYLRRQVERLLEANCRLADGIAGRVPAPETPMAVEEEPVERMPVGESM